MKIYKEIESAYDFENWLKNDSWRCEEVIEDIDEHDGWEEVWGIVEQMLNDEMSETEFNDFCRFELGDIIETLNDDEEEEEEI